MKQERRYSLEPCFPTCCQKEKAFSEVGNCIAMMIPRSTDPVVEIRQLAIESIQMCLYIDWVLKQPADAPTAMPEELLPFNELRHGRS
jgi:hypothetical protein